jgi:FkbM family methyltransferase
MKIISNLILFFKYHFIEVSIPGKSSISYKLWAISRLIKYILAGGKECGYYLQEDLEIKNSIGLFYIPKNTDLVLTVSSKSENNLLKHFDLKDPNGVFLDIGANAGKYSVMLGNQFPGSKIYSFEPNPTTFGILSRNISLNKLNSKVSLFNIGVSDSENVLSFDSVNQNTGLSRIVKADQTLTGTITKVAVKSLDFVAKEYGINPSEIDLVKIDVEGHELEVVTGGKNTFSNMKKGGRLLIEIHPESSNKKAILELSTSYRFDLQQLDEEYFLATKL